MLAKINIPNGSIELLKLTALLLMTGDHINKFLFNGTLPYLFELGRLAMPLFVLVLTYNLTRPGNENGQREIRVIKRLSLWGAIASIPFIFLLSDKLILGLFPLNILFTLLAITTIIYLLNDITARTKATIIVAAIVFIIAGAAVEFNWPAIALGVSSWYYFKRPNIATLTAILISCGSLWFINHSLGAFLALPIFYYAQQINIDIPRLKMGFYVYYPLHLTLLLLIRIPMSNAGYLFF